MKVLNKLVMRNFFLNKKRTIVTIVGIMLSTALITAVANMAESFRGSMIEYEKIYSGDFHYAFYGVKQENYKYFENNRNIESLGYIHNIGYSLLEGSENDDKPYLHISAMDEAGMRAAGINLTSGRLPQNDRELVISKHIQTNGGVSYKIGDKLTLSVGERLIVGEVSGGDAKLDQSNPYTYENEKLVPEQNIEYTVVGIIDRPNRHIEQYTAPGYTVITFLSDKTAYDKLDIFATYTKSALKNRDKVTAEILGVSEKDYKRCALRGIRDEAVEKQIDSVAANHICNTWLLKWELMDFSDSTKTMLYSVASVLIIIIIFTSIFCIRNSFVISLTEKMKLYGMMSSIGATKKQRRKLVRGEAFLLGCIGIPLGIICGALATFIVVSCTGGLMENAAGIRLVYTFSIPAMISGALLSAVTIYFSSGGAARKAAKVSPIVAIRGNETVKIKPNELRTPKLCRRLFGIGGTIAYKNLRRAKVKYRTTVISIVVSAAVFIAMTTFTQIGFKVSLMYYEDISYQIRYVLYTGDYKDDMWITQLEGVNKYTILRSGNILVNNVPYNKKYMERSGTTENSDETFQIAAIGDSEYRDYCGKLGLSYDKVKDKGILVDNYVDIDESRKRISGVKYEYKPGDIITGYDVRTMGSDDEAGTSASEDGESASDSNLKEPVNVSIEIAAHTDIRPMGLENVGKSIGAGGLIIVSDEWMDRSERRISPYRNIEFFIQCDDPDEIQKEIESRATSRNYYLGNMQESYERDRSSILLISVFLYGFIIVISLIGITNIFNTITTNMELRQRDFAMLKSIGMTKKEFRRMIWLESVFYGTKALLIGIPLGIVLSIWLYKAFLSGIELSYQLPYSGIIISILAVFVLLFVTTRYSMNKINKKNIVDTIQNENI